MLTSCNKNSSLDDETYTAMKGQDEFKAKANEYYKTYAEKLAASKKIYTTAKPSKESFMHYTGGSGQTIHIDVSKIEISYGSKLCKAVVNSHQYGQACYIDVAGFTGDEMMQLKDRVGSAIMEETGIEYKDVSFYYYLGSQGSIAMRVTAVSSGEEKTYFEISFGADAHIHYIKCNLVGVEWQASERAIPCCEMYIAYA